MSNLAIRYAFEPLRSLAAASIVTGYAAVGTPLANAARQILVQNFTDVTVSFSIDGTNAHFELPTGGYFLSDIMSNKSDMSGAYLMAKGTTLYVKRVGTPTTGYVNFTVMYGQDK